MTPAWTILAVIFAFGIAYVLYVVLKIIFDLEVRETFRTTVTNIKKAYKEASNRVKEKQSHEDKK